MRVLLAAVSAVLAGSIFLSAISRSSKDGQAGRTGSKLIDEEVGQGFEGRPGGVCLARDTALLACHATRTPPTRMPQDRHWALVVLDWFTGRYLVQQCRRMYRAH